MNESATVIIILGAPNDAKGNLSSIAIERCEQALKEYRSHAQPSVLPTGGWGAHFNTTSRPHGYYLREYLMARGIPETAFVEGAESSNTIEDAKLCRPIVARYGFQKLIVVTSDFHVARAGFLFQREFPNTPIAFSSSRTAVPTTELQKLKLHEESALAKLRQTGVTK